MLFLSDLHLDQGRPEALQALDLLLDSASRSNESIYILGDLVEVWVGDDDNSKFADDLRQVLARHGQLSELHIMHGNRDFLFGARFCDEVNATLLTDPTIVEIDGQKTLLSHGDAYCTSDTEYQKMRALFRSPAWQESILAESIEARREFARSLRQQSTAANATKAEHITDVDHSEIRSALKDHQCQSIIHGHTHRPGFHDLGESLSCYVLGSWERCAWIARTDDSIQLECIPLANGPL